MPSGIFTRLSQTTGNQDTASQVLTSNELGYYNQISLGNLFTYLYPVYRIEGATYNYYGEDYNSISYDITNGKIYTLFFSGESTTSVIDYTGKTTISHDLYRLPFTAYTAFYNNPQTEEVGDIEDFFQNKLVSVVESVSALTIFNSAYTYSFPTLYKDVGQYTQPIFNDRDQFLLDTVFYFERTNDLTLGDAYYYDTLNNVPVFLYMEPSATTIYNSNLGPSIITGDTPFTGITVNGAFFTYFVPPKKPNLNVSGGRQLIAVQGVQNNLSPTFNFSNVDDGDYYQLQVNYDVLDTPFSGTEIYTYTINKQVGDAEFVRVFSTPLRANDDFNYRIGNTKEIVNIFGNKQSITSWSDQIYTRIESSGQYYFSGYTWRNYVSNTFNGSYQISGMTIGGSTPDATTFTFTTTDVGATMQANTISAATDGVNTVTIDYTGTLYTQDWVNAVYSATNWSNLGLYVVDGSPNTGITDSSFSFSTVTQAMPDVTLTLTNIYNNTNLDLRIDRISSSRVAQTITEDYVGTSSGLITTRTSGSDGYFDFGFLNGGYYRLVATPRSPQYAAYEIIDTFITINSDLTLNLIFYIVWGNTTFTFENLTNETFL